MKLSPLTDQEKEQFDWILGNPAKTLILMRGTFKGKEVAMIVDAQETGVPGNEREIVSPMAILVTDELAADLRDDQGNVPAAIKDICDA